MIEADVVIVGGGPAGSSCAWTLKQAGMDVRILDKQQFPRHKLCAGWITPKVWRLLKVHPREYPHGLTRFDTLHFYIRSRHIPLPTRQYAIRRYEFDDWLLQRAGVSVICHKVHTIIRDGEFFIIDGQFRCRYLVGAGGSSCPVYRTFFRDIHPRTKQAQITTLEQEFKYRWHDSNCHLWFFEQELPGYSWYVPKKGGYLNIGIGAKVDGLSARGETLHYHWNLFAEKLRGRGLVRDTLLTPKGYTYFLRQKTATYQMNNAFIIGDAAGLATLDMGEGIGPAVHSGLRVARAISSAKPYRLRLYLPLSAQGILFPWL
ncbi:NAD(P)/FAD-dependent oxidoreductase [candidate division KSB1 bacterium]|nr:NAD(P)/FAD-dependent oxidoreductase [candidate division KSB1 bacterium]RQW02608.1 MAG: NAD(P)/FAD-dependent oxidoreductase [candidate division KSB1 bacterium]